MLTEAFYWDLNNATRAFSDRFAKKVRRQEADGPGRGLRRRSPLPKGGRGGGPKDGAAGDAKMKEMPTDDPLFGKGEIRPDGRKIHDMYLFEVKTPAELKGEWDLYKVLATIPGKEAFRPLNEGGCPLVKS